MKNIIRAALTQSKHRNMFGLLVTEYLADRHVLFARMAIQWRRTSMNKIVDDIVTFRRSIHWGKTWTDQIVGQHLIKALEAANVPMEPITTQKDLKDPRNIERIKVMDKNEMTQLMLSLKLGNQIRFPLRQSKTMKELEQQTELFTEHKTEAGGIDYFAPGDEFDNLIKGFMVCAFSLRKVLAGQVDNSHVGGGLSKPENISRPDYDTDSDIVNNIMSGIGTL